jgi:hypothetical protein
MSAYSDGLLGADERIELSLDGKFDILNEKP